VKISSFNIFAVFTKYEKSQDENGQEKESVCFSHVGGVGPPLAAPPRCESTPKLFSVPVSSCDFVSMYNFRLFNPPESPRSVYRFLVVFCFELFLSGVDLKLGGAMASSSDDKEKTPPEDGTKDFRLKEEVESEDEEEDQSSRPNTMIASIGVVADHDKSKMSARIRTGGLCRVTP
jgi:hypothetical protein